MSMPFPAFFAFSAKLVGVKGPFEQKELPVILDAIVFPCIEGQRICAGRNEILSFFLLFRFFRYT